MTEFRHGGRRCRRQQGSSVGRAPVPPALPGPPASLEDRLPHPGPHPLPPHPSPPPLLPTTPAQSAYSAATSTSHVFCLSLSFLRLPLPSRSFSWRVEQINRPPGHLSDAKRFICGYISTQNISGKPSEIKALAGCSS